MGAPTTTPSAAATAASVVALAERWRPERTERLRRTELDRHDVDAVIATGYATLVVPREHGGCWEGPGTLVHLGTALAAIARVDPSLALVLSMHPAVLSYWLGTPDAPEPHAAAWAEQRNRFFDLARNGHLWGTVTSEPGSGGDIWRTCATATPVDGIDAPGRFAVHGQKHFGSGFGVLPFMMTTALVADDQGRSLPDVFVLDLRELPVDGVTVTQRWDGVAMRATQSHAVNLDGAIAERAAWPFGVLADTAFAATVMLPLWVRITAAIVDEAVAELRGRLVARRSELRSYDEAEWARIDVECFQIRRIVEGMSGDSPNVGAVAVDALRAKLAVAELSESVLSRVARVAGGGALSNTSPVASWHQDVRALGFLRPPWSLAVEQLLDATLGECVGGVRSER